MLDIQYIRDNAQKIREACQNKQLDSKVVDTFLELDEQRRSLLKEVEELRKQSNANANEIKQAIHNGGKPNPKLVANGKDIKIKLKEVEPNLNQVLEKWQLALYDIPNVPADDVPVGSDESGNIVIRKEGTLPDFDFEPQPHQEIMENLDLLDTKRAVKIGGFRSYFLKNDGLMLEQALLQYSLKMLVDEGFTPMSAPILVNEETMWGTGYLPWGKEDHYVTQDGQILAGTSEVALTAYLQGETLTQKDLPIKMVGISPCFRREVGTYGKDTQGVIRVHQFNKVEMVVYTIADEIETRSWHETMVSMSERLLQDLKLPYQVLLMCTGDMGSGQRKKYDVETWFPAQDTYRETHSASYFNDFQARRLNIRYQDSNGELKHIYTLNNTMAATPRLLAAVIENYQQADGSIKVPKVLQPYLGKEFIEAKR